MFIAMDPPKHDVSARRSARLSRPTNLQRLAPIIRERAGKILDSLPIGEPFDWVDKVSIELTTMTLATLFDFPFEERRKLTRWSRRGHRRSWARRRRHHGSRRWPSCRSASPISRRLWNERVNAPPTGDLISMLAHGEAHAGHDAARISAAT